MIRSIIRNGFRSRKKIHILKISFSGWGKGQDLLADVIDSTDKPKVILDGYSTTGFDVINIIEKKFKDKEKDEDSADSGAVHMTGSILAFPHACFLWKIDSIQDVTMDSLSPTILHRPKLTYVFIGSDNPMDPHKLVTLKNQMREKAGIVLEQLSIRDAMGTFNILNGEDRVVGAALILQSEVKGTNDTKDKI
mmetsp:Transcript_37351/g.42695  ORF Transcript_37351/g.42695 Transcript_37351/m.42695 type:complete len:193 (-) Transcript_37351:284-862(-)|eukprot:CAMPEP_0194145808 /NCGR_PEP_ID=MMETSP0152-20130528/18843_1 /TAXON_ID=1049557 /ORGANISM="Thalassiothrix antarctica, Strain L6-D1" /LENGTH=192 /DNA_ID=CAMNT_0038846153 /DNA_START=40 /DNA_END=618 /DNA_ORIENTATION=+